MKISILDQSPISSHQSAQDALYDSLKLAQLGEELGYTRYWIAEHHDLPGLACSAPEIMLSFIGAQTKQIRIGSGATLLPHYKPYKVAETFNLLATLFPGRIDLGIGRAPGGTAEVTLALSDNFLQKVYRLPELLEELVHFINNSFTEDHPFAKIQASPVPPIMPDIWLLGTSEKSAKLAAKMGLPYAFGQFMSEKDGAKIIKDYRETFQTQHKKQPKTLLTVSVICAETTEKAKEIAWSPLIWQIQTTSGTGKLVPSIEEAKQYKLSEREKQELKKLKSQMIIGNPKKVVQQLKALQKTYETDEIMILTITHSSEDRFNSYRLIAEELFS